MRLSELTQPTIKLVISAARGPRGPKGDKGDKGNDGDLTPLAQAAADQIALDSSAALAAAAEATDAATSASNSAVSATNAANSAAGSATQAADSAADASASQIAAEAAQAAAEAAATGATTDARFADWAYAGTGIRAMGYSAIGVTVGTGNNGAAYLYTSANAANDSTGGLYFENYNASKYWGASCNSAGVVSFWGTMSHFRFQLPLEVVHDPYGLGWSGNYTAPTKAAIYSELDVMKDDIQILYNRSEQPQYIQYGTFAESDIQADEVLMRHVVTIGHYLEDNRVGCRASIEGLPTLGTWTANLIRVPIGGGLTQPVASVSITTAGVISFSDMGLNQTLIAEGDILKLQAPTTPDPGVTGFAVTFRGRL